MRTHRSLNSQVELEVEGYGKIVLGFYPAAAPVTVAHILRLFRLGCYDTNQIFRVDKGFVAQVYTHHGVAPAATAPHPPPRAGGTSGPISVSGRGPRQALE